MGSHYSYCGKGSKKHVIDVQKSGEVTNNGSRQTGDTFNDSITQQSFVFLGHKTHPILDFHSHQNDFIRKLSMEITDEYELKDELGVGMELERFFIFTM